LSWSDAIVVSYGCTVGPQRSNLRAIPDDKLDKARWTAGWISWSFLLSRVVELLRPDVKSTKKKRKNKEFPSPDCKRWQRCETLSTGGKEEHFLFYFLQRHHNPSPCWGIQTSFFLGIKTRIKYFGINQQVKALLSLDRRLLHQNSTGFEVFKIVWAGERLVGRTS
jgi:hypothetical protein